MSDPYTEEAMALATRYARRFRDELLRAGVWLHKQRRKLPDHAKVQAEPDDITEAAELIMSSHPDLILKGRKKK